ncbi:MAG: conjugative relaxase [Alphaproteobacteria bacterium]|nr:MAG: conjugative relaxase [Alphaproteobacteria bacterium]
MLSIGVMSGGQAGYYLSLAGQDYYTLGGEPPGQWMGEGAEALGLLGEVEPRHLYNLFDGLSPDGSKRLVQFQKHEGKQIHRPGWDLTFSAPKSVSVLWSQVGPEIREAISKAHHGALREAVRYLEDEAVVTRRGKAGRINEQARTVVAVFEHSTSRALDPQLHSHALLLNVAVREDGSTGVVSSPKVFASKMTAGALYRTELAYRLEQDLGLPIRKRGAFFEVEGVSKDLSESFSKRRFVIENLIRERGIVDAAGASRAAIETRSAKEDVSRSKLEVEWLKQGKLAGWSTIQAESLLGTRTRISPDIEGSVSAAVSRLVLDAAHFTRRELLRAVAEEGQGRCLSAGAARSSVDEALSYSPDLVRFLRPGRETRFTHRSVLDAEDRCFNASGNLSQKRTHEVDSLTVEREIQRSKSLSQEQANAVRNLTRSSGDFAVLSGIAGSGKTSTLSTAARIWEAAGYEVQGLALSGRASRQLEQGAGIESTTVGKSLYEMEKSLFPIRWSSEGKRLYFDFEGRQFEIHDRSVVVLDEAGMVNTNDFARLAEECQKRGAKLVAAGDHRQLQAVTGASPFAELIHRFGSAVLDTVLRQSEPWARQAVRDFAEGRSEEALFAYAQRGQVHVAPEAEGARKKLIEEWSKSPEKASDKLILTDRKADRDLLNQMAQDARKGELGMTWTTVGGKRLYMGDRVSFTKTSQARGVNSGDRGELVAINPLPGKRAATVKLDSGEKVTVDVSRFPHLDLGYASTTHGAQGETVREAYILTGSGMQDRSLSYVQASRAKDKTSFFMTEADAGMGLCDIVKHMARDSRRTTAAEEMRSKRGLSF